jgi:hypothetical protein
MWGGLVAPELTMMCTVVSVKPPVVDGTPVTGSKLANADQKVVGYGGREAEVLIANLYQVRGSEKSSSSLETLERSFLFRFA